MNNNDYLAHYGILGMKWGVRRYQNKDGTLTAKGKRRYNDETSGKRARAIDAEPFIVRNAKKSLSEISTSRLKDKDMRDAYERVRKKAYPNPVVL